MNTVVTSKEAILQTSRRLIQEQGWSAVNIRSVAKACDISVGTIYNYFGGKSDLVAATVESVWQDIFHMPEGQEAFGSVTSCIQWAFDRMQRGNALYPGFFSMHAMSFMGEDKSGGQALMARSWRHMQAGFYQVLLRDEGVSPHAFDDRFTAEKFVEILFSLILSALFRNDYDCAGIVAMVERLLYQ